MAELRESRGAIKLVRGRVGRGSVVGRRRVRAWVKGAAVAVRGGGSARTWRARVVVRVVMAGVRGSGVEV